MFSLTPKALQEKITAISQESYDKYQELAGLESELDTIWLETRATCKTDGECTRKVNASEKGSRARYLRTYLKGLGHLRTALIREDKANSGGSW